MARSGGKEGFQEVQQAETALGCLLSDALVELPTSPVDIHLAPVLSASPVSQRRVQRVSS